MKEKQTASQKTFEEDLQRLEQIVSLLESGDLPLQETLKLYEEGRRLARQCSKKLDEVEGRLQVLMSADGDSVVLDDFCPEEGK